MLFDVKGPRPWNFHSTTLTMFASNLQLSNSTYRPQGLSAKTFYIFMLFYGFLLVSQFNSFFIQVLTRGLYERQVSTIAEIIQRRLDVVGSLDTRSFFVNQTHDEVQAWMFFICELNNISFHLFLAFNLYSQPFSDVSANRPMPCATAIPGRSGRVRIAQAFEKLFAHDILLSQCQHCDRSDRHADASESTKRGARKHNNSSLLRGGSFAERHDPAQPQSSPRSAGNGIIWSSCAQYGALVGRRLELRGRHVVGWTTVRGGVLAASICECERNAPAVVSVAIWAISNRSGAECV